MKTLFMFGTRSRLLKCAAMVSLAWVAATCRAQQPLAPPAINPPAPSADSAEFLKAADEVLAEMSKVLSLPVLQPLKKSVRSRDEIRDYLVKQMNDDKDDAKRHADVISLEALGLIPAGYPLDQKMLKLLTEQIAGLYDPESREFFIADWTEPGEQRTIMAHELTHALEDQHFQVEKWEKAAKPNDDAGLARDAVLEGSATIAMLDYLIRGTGKTSFDIDDLDPSLLLGNVDDSPEMSQAPLIIQDEMLFPYLPGATFVQRVLRTWGGWSGLHKIFEQPPASTQQILHPDLYLKGVMPVPVSLPKFEGVVPKAWTKLDENVLGEFNVNEIFKKFIGSQRADQLAPAWRGDRYAIFEKQPGGHTLLVIRIQLASDADAARYFGGYSEVLERKNETRTELMRRPNFFSFQTPNGGVFLRCLADQCLSAEGTTRQVFDAMTRSMKWPVGPEEPRPAADPSLRAFLNPASAR